MSSQNVYFRLTWCAALLLPSAIAMAEAVEPPPAGELTEIQVTARRLDEARNQLMPDVGASEYRLGVEDLKNLPLGESTPLNQVLLRAPGVTQDSFGQLHVRGDHANLQYRINDVVIPESIALFGQALNPRFASEINLLTGALPAQYGYRTAGVVDIHTKGSDYHQGAELNLMTGTTGHREMDGEVSGSADTWSYYATGGYLQNNLGIENPEPTPSAHHDHTEQWNGFAYVAHVLPNAARISLMAGVADDAFEIPVRAGQVAEFLAPGLPAPDSAHLDQRQHEGNRYVVLAYENASGGPLHYQVALYDRQSAVHYAPDPAGDLAFTGASGDISRTNARWGLQLDASAPTENHTLRFGFTYHDETARSVALTQVYALDAAGDPIYDAVTLADQAQTHAQLWGAYLQDEWHPFDRWTINLGTRFDSYDALLHETQWSPRLGVVVELSGGTTLHAGYARYFTPPATEKISSETIGLFAGTTGAPPSTDNAAVRAERSHYFDVGMTTRLLPQLTLGVDTYYRKITDLGDEGQFGPAVLFAPFNYAKGRIYGAETTLSWQRDGTSAYVNMAWSRAEGTNIVTGQYNFAPDELAAIAQRWIPLDHDQRFTVSGGVAHTVAGVHLSADFIAGTGLRAGALNADHLPGYIVCNVAARRTFVTSLFGELEWSLSIVNALDRVYELRDGSGVGVGAPQWGQRRGAYLSVSRAFGR
jgi:outer membrane receptor protein involved in Fe transport